MRFVIWNCNMALHRKVDAILALEPDLAIVSECAEPNRLREKSETDWIEQDPVWIGNNAHKGLGVFSFCDARLELCTCFDKNLRHIAPVSVQASTPFHLLAVWAQNASGGITRKHQLGPLRRALSRYRDLLDPGPGMIAGDWNSNAIWDKPGWRINHMAKVRILDELGIVSVYHSLTGERDGEETVPTLYWRDRREDGPTYHIDFAFVPSPWLHKITHFEIGSFADWCGNGLSDHVPLIVDIDL